MAILLVGAGPTWPTHVRTLDGSVMGRRRVTLPPVDHRSVARITASGRVAVGTALLVVPGAVTRGWIGPTGAAPGARLLGRGLGVRDLTLGLGVLGALGRGDPRARDWIRASAVADGGDAVATVLAYRHLPRRARFGVLALAAGAAALGFVAAENLD